MSKNREIYNSIIATLAFAISLAYPIYEGWANSKKDFIVRVSDALMEYGNSDKSESRRYIISAEVINVSRGDIYINNATLELGDTTNKVPPLSLGLLRMAELPKQIPSGGAISLSYAFLSSDFNDMKGLDSLKAVMRIRLTTGEIKDVDVMSIIRKEVGPLNMAEVSGFSFSEYLMWMKKNKKSVKLPMSNGIPVIEAASP